MLKINRRRSKASILVMVGITLLVSECATSVAAKGTRQTTYFVSRTGKDTADCGNSVNPCQTITRAVSLCSAGDTISVHAGTYYESIKAQKNGSPGQPITLKAYGDGEVIIDGSVKTKGWKVDSGSVYRVDYPVTYSAKSYPPMQVIVDNVPLATAAPYLYPGSRSSITIGAGQFFFDINTHILYASLSDGTSPESHDTLVLYDVDHTNWTGHGRDPGRLVNTVSVGNYWTIESVTIRGAPNYGLGMGDHAVLKNSKVWFNAWTGTAFGQHSTVTDNTVAWNMMANWPRGRCQVYNANQASVRYQSCWIWGSWGGGLLVGAGYSTVTGNTVYMNGGEGLISYLGAGHNYVHGNTVYDNWSVNVYMDGEPYDTVDGNLVYCNDPQPSWTYNSGAANAGSAINKRLRPTGISTADECYSGCAAAQGHDATIINNVITSCRIGLTKYTQAPGSGLINEIWAHNTITLPSVNGIDFIDGGSGPDRYIGIVVNDNGNARNAYIVDNIVYGRGSTNAVLQNTSTTSPQWPGITLEHNLFYHPTNPKPFQFYRYPGSGSRAYSFAEWKTLAKAHGSANDVYGDPLFVKATSFVAADRQLSSRSSPAKGTGVAVPGVTKDFNGFPYATPPSIGAFEYGSASGDGTSTTSLKSH